MPDVEVRERLRSRHQHAGFRHQPLQQAIHPATQGIGPVPDVLLPVFPAQHCGLDHGTPGIARGQSQSVPEDTARSLLVLRDDYGDVCHLPPCYLPPQGQRRHRVDRPVAGRDGLCPRPRGLIPDLPAQQLLPGNFAVLHGRACGPSPEFPFPVH